MRHKKFALSAVSTLVVSSVAYANAGTPLMLAGTFHLVIGNAVIGLLEGMALALFFARPKIKTVMLLILANYFSAWVGGMFMREALVSAVPMDLNNLRPTFWTMVLITYLITLVLEFPFVVLVFRHDTRWLRNSMLGTLAVQTASYVFLFWCYWQASGVSLLTETAVVKPGAISLPENVVVYFISAEDGDVYELRLAEMVEVGRIYDLNSRGLDDRIIFRNSAGDEDSQELVVRIDTRDSENPAIVPLGVVFSGTSTPRSRAVDAEPPREWETWFNFGEARALGDAESSHWEFTTGFWAAEGIRGTRKDSGSRLGFSFETPFGAWTVRNAIHLPTDKILLQLGDDQVCLYDPLTQRIALLAKGHGPTAAIKVRETDGTGSAAAYKENSER